MSTQDKKEQAINPQPERDEPNTPTPRPEEDESRIGGQAAGQSSGGESPDSDAEGTGARAGEYS